MSILDVQGFSKQFFVHHLQRQIPAFNEVDFRLHAGEFLLVRGVNGVGKSTLLRCLYRSYLPTAGRAIYHAHAGLIDLACAADVDIAALRRTEIGHVTQFLRARPRVSAIDVVIEPLLSQGHSRAEAHQIAAEWLDAFGLKADIWDAYPSTFSGGEQQKVNLVRALIVPRRLLLLDEPTASLDASARAALVARLAQIKAQGVAMIGVFHHPEDVRDLVDGELHLTNVQVDYVAN
ncbi:phosphonate C-P lyase system protein PhnL [Candidatus Oscillochloris fontis]|uniref:phosphonate C-P lyase system protein PhnL n=1 Tax=Candidatus Oscillochloris fontis TaxID=2496868 RepID=UPI00101B91F2|nr:ATP-binding cassette domain-containing protein [Candidatus Oscillochloris fontis]